MAIECAGDPHGISLHAVLTKDHCRRKSSRSTPECQRPKGGDETHVRPRHSSLSTFCAMGTAPSVLSRKYLYMKSRISGQGVVANPRDTTRYRCGLRLALTRNSQFHLYRYLRDRTLVFHL